MKLHLSKMLPLIIVLSMLFCSNVWAAEIEPQAIKNVLYPTKVEEMTDLQNKKIIKVYELSESEKPTDIPSATFERNGWLYTLTDITKNETTGIDKKEYTAVKTIETSTNDLAVILNQLETTMLYESKDGYKGNLNLDIATVKCETAGYKKSNYTINATREYPHLSSNDSSLIPKTISENGKTLTLTNVSWQAQNTTTVDYDAIPDSYKAIAKYSASATKSSVTGYVTTAEYKGNIEKMMYGKTIYTAYFNGVEISPPEPEPTPEPILEPVVEVKKPINVLPIVGGTTGGLGIIGGLVFFFFIRRNVRVFNLKNGAYPPIGSVRVSYKNPVIDLSKFTEKASSGSFILVLDKMAAKKLNGEAVTVNYGEKSMQHIINSIDEEYQFSIDF